MDAKSKLVLNGGSGGLYNEPQKFAAGAGGLHVPSYSARRESVKKAALIIVIAAFMAAKENNQ